MNKIPKGTDFITVYSYLEALEQWAKKAEKEINDRKNENRDLQDLEGYLILSKLEIKRLKESNLILVKSSVNMMAWLAKDENTDIAARWLIQNKAFMKALNK